MDSTKLLMVKRFFYLYNCKTIYYIWQFVVGILKILVELSSLWG